MLCAPCAITPVSWCIWTSRSWAASRRVAVNAWIPAGPRPGAVTNPPAGRGPGFEYVHVAVDDASRWAYVEALPDERGDTAASFLERMTASFAARGINVQRVLTGRRLLLPRQGLPQICPRPDHQTQTHPSLPAPDQRQGRSLHPHPATRVGPSQALLRERPAASPSFPASSTATITPDPISASAVEPRSNDSVNNVDGKYS